MTLIDNRSRSPELRATWGLSIYVEVGERKILFDTGPSWRILYENAYKLGVNLSEVEYVVLSHWHYDHAGALPNVLSVSNAKAVVPERVRGVIVDEEKIVIAEKPLQIFENAITTGALKGRIKEQSLLLISDRGAIVLTGCAHPGLKTVLKASSEICGKIYALIGGFHISGFEADKALRVIERYNVEKVSPCHCTSLEAIREISLKHRGYIENGVGTIIEF